MIRPKLERGATKLRQGEPSQESPGKVFRASDIPGFHEPEVEGREGTPGALTTQTDAPTKKQLDYLYALGYVGLPPKTKAAASAAIEAEKAKIEEEKRREFRANLRMDF